MQNKLAILFIKGTDNNTIVNVCNINKETLFLKTGGQKTKAGREKNSVKIVIKIFSDIKKFLDQNQINKLELRFRNRGSMYAKNITPAVRYLNMLFEQNYHVLNVTNNNPIIHGYIRPKSEKSR